MTNILYVSGGVLMGLGVLISLIGYILTKRGGGARWKYWAVGMLVLGIGLAIQMWIENQNAPPA